MSVVKAHDAVAERRMKVSMMMAQSYPKTEITERLGISPETLNRDIAWLQSLNADWLAATAKEGFIFENRMAIEKLKYQEQRLSELRVRCQSDIKDSVMLERAIMDNVKLQLEIIGKGPMLYALNDMLKRKFVTTTDEGKQVLEQVGEEDGTA